MSESVELSRACSESRGSATSAIGNGRGDMWM
jgi:hypothetical protein